MDKMRKVVMLGLLEKKEATPRVKTRIICPMVLTETQRMIIPNPARPRPRSLSVDGGLSGGTQQAAPVLRREKKGS